MGMHAMYDRKLPPAKPFVGVYIVDFVDPETGKPDDYRYFYYAEPVSGPGSKAYAKQCAEHSARMLGDIPSQISHQEIFPDPPLCVGDPGCNVCGGDGYVQSYNRKEGRHPKPCMACRWR